MEHMLFVAMLPAAALPTRSVTRRHVDHLSQLCLHSIDRGGVIAGPLSVAAAPEELPLADKPRMAMPNPPLPTAWITNLYSSGASLTRIADL